MNKKKNKELKNEGNLGESEFDIPQSLSESIKAYTEGTGSSIADCLYCELEADINAAEIEGTISSIQAQYLRKKYLGY